MLIAAQMTRSQAIEQFPAALRKMGLDEGEKFMPEDYAFTSLRDSVEASPILPRFQLLSPDEEFLLALNSSAVLEYRPPFIPHFGQTQQTAMTDREEEYTSGRGRTLFRKAAEALLRLQGRQFACPTGTASCGGIGYPNYCCQTGETCFRVDNNPNSGNLGCCPSGTNCGGTVAQCAGGSTACAAEVGGGCCIPGFVCAGIGCKSSTVGKLV